MCKKENSAVDLIKKMLNEMRHRGPDDVGVLINNEVIHANSLKTLNLREKQSFMSIGSSRLAILDHYKGPQPIKGCKDFFIALNGEIYNYQELKKELTGHGLTKSIDTEVVIHLFEEQMNKFDLIESIKRTLGYLDGMYAFAIVFKDRIIVSRDPVGIKPLYLVENNDLIAFASERKALWRLGMTDGIFPLNPGSFAIIGRKGIQFYKGIGLKEANPLKINLEDTKKNLLSLLISSIKKMVKYQKLGILFSGGLDSSLIAYIANNLKVNIELFCASLDGFDDKQNAFRGAKRIGLPLNFYELTVKDIEKCLPKILYAIEEPNPMNLSIAIPIYFATKLARKKSFKVVLSGQGSDEIFAGYSRYVKILENEGYQKLHQILCQDISNIANKNLQRDDGASMANGVEVRVPFLDLKLLNYSMSIPPKFKIKKVNSNYVRKYILRSLAKSLNLPDEIINQKKTAVQYGSGTWKTLKALAEKNGHDNVQKYLNEEFEKILRDFHN
jgi:asparagine synthase (glutamine-hydrolysing)